MTPPILSQHSIRTWHARTDAALVSDLAGGEMTALAELVRRHQEKILRLCYRILGRWDIAEDAAQETFLKVYRSAGRYRPEARFTTWLYRIATNLCIDLKRRARRAPVELTAEDMLPVEAREDPLEAAERAMQVRKAVESLPQRQRVAVILQRYESLSYREIAEITGWSESAVESLLVRAYAKLRDALADLQEN